MKINLKQLRQNARHAKKANKPTIKLATGVINHVSKTQEKNEPTKINDSLPTQEKIQKAETSRESKPVSKFSFKLPAKTKVKLAPKVEPEQIVNQPLIPIPSTETALAQTATEVAKKPTLVKAQDSLRKSLVVKKAEPVTALSTSRLMDETLVLDESQKRAVAMAQEEKYMCLIGAAGTGKTTCEKLVIDGLYSSCRAIDISGYWKPSHDKEGNRTKDEMKVPSICLCAFTGQATQMIKKNFPKSWHPNIMTIHRMLNYYPEYYQDFDDKGELVNKMRFVPSYGRQASGQLLPWDIIIIDEAGMLAVDLWEKIYDALRPETRIILVGDINQLPPVHGKPILAHAMMQWPVAELTTIHRQKGKNNPIVENAWRILRGEKPIQYPTYSMFELPTNPTKAQAFVRQIYKAFREKRIKGKILFDPDKDVIITPINGDKISDGAPLGQIPLNDIISAIDLKNYKEDHDKRYLINAGREKKPFAVGDRVMATKNDYTIGITNGMMGEIVEIVENSDYMGSRSGYGILNLAEGELPQDQIAANPEFKLDVEDFLARADEYIEKGKAAQEAARGAASHIVTVRFGPKPEDPEAEDKDGLFVAFSTFSEICSLQLCYAITCHKSQGAEFDTVIIVLHSTHSKMLYREWLYTAATRPKTRVILLYTEKALASALGSQRIGGATLKEKIKSFALLAKINPNQIPNLQEPQKIENKAMQDE